MRIRVTLAGGLAFDGELYSNPVAADFATRLPLAAAFADFNNVEKVAKLETPLRVSGVPDQDSPAPGEIGYYAPNQALVLYYGSVGSWPGLVRIGAFDLDPTTLRDQSDGFVAHFAGADDSR